MRLQDYACTSFRSGHSLATVSQQFCKSMYRGTHNTFPQLICYCTAADNNAIRVRQATSNSEPQCTLWRRCRNAVKTPSRRRRDVKETLSKRCRDAVEVLPRCSRGVVETLLGCCRDPVETLHCIGTARATSYLLVLFRFLERVLGYNSSMHNYALWSSKACVSVERNR